jgi:hypothetical protein
VEKGLAVGQKEQGNAYAYVYIYMNSGTLLKTFKGRLGGDPQEQKGSSIGESYFTYELFCQELEVIHLSEAAVSVIRDQT